MKRFACILFLLMTMPFGKAFALSSDWQREPEVSVRLISGVDAVGQGGHIPLGLEVEMGPDWHTYWRSPGMAGLPPQIDWKLAAMDGTGSTNLKSVVLEYPAPRRYSAFGLETVGYRDHVLFPIDAELVDPGHAVDIKATLNILVCSSICLPKTFELKLTIPAGDASASADAGLIQDARNLKPADADASGLLIGSVTNKATNLIFDIQSRDELKSPDVFLENNQNIYFGAPVISISDDKHSARLTIKLEDALPPDTALAGMKMVATIVNDGHALEQKLVIPPAAAAALPEQPKQIPVSVAILLALLGGLILNLMPCVLPVLSLKIFGAIGHGGGETGAVRRSFLMTAAGIIFSFMVLAGVTIGLKSLGFVLGWGVQFQQPLFLMTLVLLLTFFAANMWGLFEFGLPSWVADGLGNASYHPKLAGDFMTGAFATLLATPCSAPFLGTAVGFALASGIPEIILVFLALGIGMAIPYLCVAIFPRMATALPKPGAWMLVVRKMLGIALAATAVWMIWIMAAQITVPFAALVGLCMTSMILVLGFGKTNVNKILVKIGVVVFALAAFAVTFAGPMVPRKPVEVERRWLPFDMNALKADISEGKTVFVDVTADWCLTCKANERFVLSKDDIQQKLFHSDIIAMQADWTNPDPVISDFLHMYGRYGIPFNIVYGPGAEKGVTLPELLTHDGVIEAIATAQGNMNRKP